MEFCQAHPRQQFRPFNNQIRESRQFLKEKTGKWMVISSGDTRRLEREEIKIRNEMLMIRKGKFGKISGKKLTVTEDVILRNQTQRWADMCEVDQNVSREQIRRQGKKKKSLEDANMSEGRTGSASEQEEESHWMELLTNMAKIRNTEEWLSASCMGKMCLEDMRKLAYGDSTKKAGMSKKEEKKKCSKRAGKSEKDGLERNAWNFWKDRTDKSDANEPTNQPKVVQEAEENLKKLTEDNFNLDRAEDCFIDVTDKLKFGIMFGRSSEMHEEDQERRGRKDVTPGKSRKLSEMLRDGAHCTATVRKDVARLTRNEKPNQERSPGGEGGRVMKTKRCTPHKIKKISSVSTLKLLFETPRNTSSLTRGCMELLRQSNIGLNLTNPGVTTTTTRDANGQDICVSQSDGLRRTGPRQAGTLDSGVSQDWWEPAGQRGGEPMGDTVPGRDDQPGS